MIQARQGQSFTIPFLLGTILGIVSGTVVGVLVARHVITLAQRLLDRATGSRDGEGPRLDLLLQ